MAPTAGTLKEKQEFFRAPVATPSNAGAIDTAGAPQSSDAPSESSSSVQHVSSEQREHTETLSDSKRNEGDDAEVPAVAKEASVENVGDVGVEPQHKPVEGIEAVHQHESHESGSENVQKDVSMGVGSGDQQTGDPNNVVEVGTIEQDTIDEPIQPAADSIDAADDHSGVEINLPPSGLPIEKPVAEILGICFCLYVFDCSYGLCVDVAAKPI